jgi:bile acid:Na+ symporter, BASS family
MTTQQVVILVLQVSILLTVFGFGLRTTLHDLQYLLRRPGLLARSLLAMFVIMPIVAVILVWAFELRPSFEIALLALAISPVPPLLPGKEGKAGGHAAYGLALMAVVSVLAIVVVPLWVQLLGLYADRQLRMPPVAIAKVVVVMTILPLITGVIVRTLLPAVAARLEKPARLVSTVLLVGGAAVLLIAAVPVILNVFDIGIVLATAVFIVVGLAAGHWLGGPQAEDATVLALSTASRHPAIALAVAKLNFPDEPQLGATILLYLIVLAVLTVPYVLRQRHLSVARQH